MKKELLIVGHPHTNSFCHALAAAYLQGAYARGKTIETLYLDRLSFDLNLTYAHWQRTQLEPDLVEAQTKIRTADHLVWIFPVWWSTVPTLVKGFLDRVLTPGFAFEDSLHIPQKLLNGKTASLLITMNHPVLVYRFWQGNPLYQSFVRGTLGFCGIKTQKIYYFGSIKRSSDKQRHHWLQQATVMGLD